MDLRKTFTDWKSTGTFWLLLGIVALLLDIFVVGTTRWEFPYGLTYALGFIAVGIVLSNTGKTSIFGSLSAMLIGLVAVLVEVTGGSFLGAVSGATLSFFLFAVVIVTEFGGIGKRLTEAKYATIAVFGAWFIWPIIYFYNRAFVYNLPINLDTFMYHGGIMLLAGLEALTLVGAWKFKYRDEARLLFFLVALVGMVLTVGVLGWGLQLLP